MGNEPVAWIPFAWYCAWLSKNNEPVWEQYEECHPATKQWDNFPDKIIPLYTHPVNPKYDPETGEPLIDGYPLFSGLPHPVKELTDEEILDLCPPNHSDMMNKAYTIDFARAILRKAQEADKIESLGTVNIGGVHFRNGKEVK